MLFFGILTAIWITSAATNAAVLIGHNQDDFGAASFQAYPMVVSMEIPGATGCAAAQKAHDMGQRAQSVDCVAMTDDDEHVVPNAIHIGSYNDDSDSSHLVITPAVKENPGDVINQLIPARWAGGMLDRCHIGGRLQINLVAACEMKAMSTNAAGQLRHVAFVTEDLNAKKIAKTRHILLLFTTQKETFGESFAATVV